ncbi:MAG: hypothetical protein HY319_20400 [Armatimonadetes bacterium]|nr:hypothetical protein [Armatimonadota bacterium]
MKFVLGVLLLGCAGFVFIVFAQVDARIENEYIGCRNSLAAIGDALKLYSDDHGNHYPADLTELQPDYLSHVPRCYSSEKPYRYRSSSDGFRVECEGPHPTAPHLPYVDSGKGHVPAN